MPVGSKLGRKYWDNLLIKKLLQSEIQMAATSAIFQFWTASPKHKESKVGRKYQGDL